MPNYVDLAEGVMKPVALGKGEGRAVPAQDERIRVKLESKAREYPFDVIEVRVPPGQGTPAHVHSHEDESFYVLEGVFAFLVGDKVIPGPAGSYVFGPRTIPHGFQNVGDKPGRLLVHITPGGFVPFLEALFEEVGSDSNPVNAGEPSPAVKAILVKYGIGPADSPEAWRPPTQLGSKGGA